MFSDGGAGTLGCASQDEGEGHLSLASYPLASELIGQGSPTAANGRHSYTPLSPSLTAFSTLSSENSGAGDEASMCAEPI